MCLYRVGSLDVPLLEFITRQISDNGQLQVFLFDPNGVKVELNFCAADAKGIKAQPSPAQFGAADLA